MYFLSSHTVQRVHNIYGCKCRIYYGFVVKRNEMKIFHNALKRATKETHTYLKYLPGNIHEQKPSSS